MANDRTVVREINKQQGYRKSVRLAVARRFPLGRPDKTIIMHSAFD